MGRALLFRNGMVLTGDPGHPVATAVAIDDGVIVALDDDALEHRARGAAEFDLAGGCLVPGFRDGHAHPLWGGIELGQVPLVGATSVDDLIERAPMPENIPSWPDEEPRCAPGSPPPSPPTHRYRPSSTSPSQNGSPAWASPPAAPSTQRDRA